MKNFSEPVLDIRNITQTYQNRSGHASKALADIDLCLFNGEILGIVGESGAGKSSLARLICGIETPLKGSVLYKNKPVHDMPVKTRAKTVQMVFQNPRSALDPGMTIDQNLGEVIDIHNIEEKQILEALSEVGMDASCLEKKPSSLSGGQLQRIVLARALLLKPAVLIADEPVSSLDVSIQAQILNLLKNLKQTHFEGMIFISHDMAVVRFLCSRIAVLQEGYIQEIAPTDVLINNSVHPYTKSLLAAAKWETSDSINMNFEDIVIDPLSHLVEIDKDHWVRTS
ncbi:MAG: ABC transporter ATP-binding protein [Candidatus Theseobacter exili]|nr:ABC transporter ATP-binding protein [Candidatus Theseobacter exili]